MMAGRDDAITAYPLCWPAGWPRAASRRRSQFKTTFSAARSGVNNELRLLGARNVVISTNLPLKQNGELYSSTTKREPEDPAVSVYFTLDGQTRCIPVDKWDRVGDNLHAIALTIGALRGLDRWGAKEMVNAAFQGFAALPAGAESGWWSVLEIAPNASDDEIESAYRRLARVHHPDAGGNGDDFYRITQAYRQAKGRRTA